MKYFTLSLLLSLGFSLQLLGQAVTLQIPDASPKASVSQRVGLTDVSIDYNRPAVREREIWGALVPYDAVWRAGANENTVFTCSHTIKLNGSELPAGKYGFHIIPGKENSILIFSNNNSQWGSYSYNDAEDALRVNIKNAKADKFHEYLTYSFEPISTSSAKLSLLWGEMAFSVDIETDVHETVLNQIRKDLQTKPGWTWLGWNEAAAYCLRNEVNLEEGLQWATRSVFINPNPNNLQTKALLTGKIEGKGDEAKEKAAAITSFKSDLERQNCTWKEYSAAANFAVQQESWDQALSWADQAVKMSPNMTAMMAKSAIYNKKGDTKMAERVKKEAIAKGTNAELNQYGYQLLQSGKTADAVEIFKVNTERNPEDPNVWDSLGEGYFFNKQKDEAIKAFKKSLSLNPPDNVKANSMSYLARMGVKEEMKP
ncbi:MAG: DUF2911 domain-containing protein [Saprospiraceae bacterium]